MPLSHSSHSSPFIPNGGKDRSEAGQEEDWIEGKGTVTGGRKADQEGGR